MYVTDGRTNVHCRWCRTKLTPTTAESLSHPHNKMTAEQIQAEQKQLDDVMNYLRTHGFDDE